MINEKTSWLGGFGHRRAITIKKFRLDDIKEKLLNFPLLISLGTSSGRDNEDLTDVFDKLEKDENRLKIAVTTADGITQCHIEIEEWNADNQKAFLWTAVPMVDPNYDTQLYFYYDKDAPDNTDYVGNTGSIPAKNVWDKNFVFVSHHSSAPTANEVKK